MAEFGQFLGPAIANAGQQLGGYFDQRDKQKRENQILAQDQSNKDREFQSRQQQMALKPMAQANAPKYKSVEELHAALIAGLEPDPDGSKMKAVQHVAGQKGQREYKPSEFELFQQNPQAYQEYKSAGRAPVKQPTMLDRQKQLFPDGRFLNPYPMQTLGQGQNRALAPQQPASNVSNGSVGSDPDTQFRSMYDDWDSLNEQEKQAVRQYHAGGGR